MTSGYITAALERAALPTMVYIIGFTADGDAIFSVWDWGDPILPGKDPERAFTTDPRTAKQAYLTLVQELQSEPAAVAPVRAIPTAAVAPVSSRTPGEIGAPISGVSA